MNPFPKNPAHLEEEAQQQQELLEFLKANPEIMKQYQQEVTKMQGKNRTAMHQPMNSQEYLTKLKNGSIEQSLDEEGGLLIQPEKGLVLKLFDKHSGEKIFVNVVKHEAVDHPEQKVLVDLQNQAGLRIPMSVGRVRQDNDKKGVPCKTVDVVMNPKIIESAQKNADIFFFMAQIISNYLLEKYKIMVAEDKITKVNLKYKGNHVEMQRIKARKSPKIEEVPQQKSREQEESEERLLSGLSEHAGSKQKQPEFKVYGVGYDGAREEYSLESKGQVRSLQLQFDLSLLIHSRGIHLQASDRVLYLFVKGLYEICLKLPEPVRAFSAQFSRKERALRVYCDVQEVGKEEEKSVVKGKAVNIQIESSLLDQLV